MKIEWKKCPPIPPRTGTVVQFGLSGPVAGADGDWVVVAGGSNFEEGMPWKGGLKKFHDDIYLLQETHEGWLSWDDSAQKLPQPMAYSACVALEKGFITLGGENEKGILKTVLRYRISKGKVIFETLPDLPIGLSSPGAALIGDRIYVCGGLSQKGASSGLYSLSINHPESGWETLPRLPVKRSHGVVIAQRDHSETALYFIGGRCLTGEITTFYSTVYKYSPRQNKWMIDSNITFEGGDLPLSAGTGMAYGDHQIILFGGDRGILFNQTELMNNRIQAEKDPEQKRGLVEAKERFLTHHTGFSKDILGYNTLTKKWNWIGLIPGVPPVTTGCFKWKNYMVIPAGEIRPGVRTDRVLLLEIH